MANASYIQDSFAGGEKSQLAQGRITEREYRTWMNVCFNGHPTEGGGWVRRSGTAGAGFTRGGLPGRVFKFDFAQATPYTVEATDGFFRFRQGLGRATTNDAASVLAVSSANPAVVQVAAATGWATGNTVVFGGLGVTVPTLQNRQFVITVVDATHFSLADAITGVTIDGSTLGAIGPGVTALRIQELATPYTVGSWATLRIVQAETNAVLLQGTIPPQLLSVTTLPSGGNSAVFGLAGLTFLDGPYLDPFTNGVKAVPNGTKGNITLSLVFPQFDSGKAYKVGDFVTSVAINYESLIDNNVGNTPAGSPTAWAVVQAGAAINNGQGFLGSDVGRLVRLFSEPAPWNAATAYTAGQVVSYNPTGLPNSSTYWTALVNNTGKIPGNDVTNWTLTPGNAANWTWGRITSLAGSISQATGSPIGTMTQGGGLTAAFDGIILQPASQSAEAVNSLAIVDRNPHTLTLDVYVGKNFTASPQQVASVVVTGATDTNIFYASAFGITSSLDVVINAGYVVNLRAKATAPISASDGTLLATTGISGSTGGNVSVTLPNSITLASNDPVTSWNYIWVEFIANVTFASKGGFGPPNQTLQVIAAAAEVQFFAPSAGSSGNAVNIEVLGQPLLYTNPIITWRLGAYSSTTGWPTCGTYHEGRIWLGGAIGNRFDASVSNGLIGTTLDMTPTDQNGTVGAANAITGVVNSDGVNPIFWFTPDLQGVIMGTQAGEWLISAPAAGAMSPTNISAHRVTRIGCANVEPRKTDHTNVFVQRYTRRVMEYFTDVYSGKFSAPNLAKDTLHITKPGVAELAYTQAVVPAIWGRNADGSWWGATYKRDTLATSTGPTINGWHRHALGSGRSVQSICSGPSVGGNLDALTMVTLDPVTGLNYVEIMTDVVEEGDTLIDATYLDDAINPSSVTTSNTSPAPYGGLTLNGFWRYNGQTVTAWLGGLDCGDYVVVNGSIVVPYGDGISAGTAAGLFTAAYAATLSLSQMLVGFTFTSQGQLVRPATPQESGARNGPAVGKVRRNQKIAAQFEGTGVGVEFGTTFAKLDPAKFRQPNDIAYLVNQQFNGVYKNTLTDGHSLDGMICWQQTRPRPLNIANLGGFIETVDE